METKVIVITEWLKFVNSKPPVGININPFRHGYWNVALFTEELQNFLSSNNIQYKVVEKFKH